METTDFDISQLPEKSVPSKTPLLGEHYGINFANSHHAYPEFQALLDSQANLGVAYAQLQLYVALVDMTMYQSHINDGLAIYKDNTYRFIPMSLSKKCLEIRSYLLDQITECQRIVDQLLEVRESQLDTEDEIASKNDSSIMTFVHSGFRLGGIRRSQMMISNLAKERFNVKSIKKKKPGFHKLREVSYY